jgi:ABC-type transport system substrate-binding protein
MRMTRRRLPWIAGVAVVVVAGLSFLGARSWYASRSSGSELRLALVGVGEINTLDPLRAGTTAPIMVVWQTHERLVDIGARAEPIPMIAASWSADEARRVWRFRIRSDRTFNEPASERRVGCPDVEFSLERALRLPGVGQTLLGELVADASQLIERKTTTLDAIRCDGDDLVITLSRPFVDLPLRLAASFLSVVPVGTPDEPRDPPAGSGPYRIASWNPSSGRVALALSGGRAANAEAPRRLEIIVSSSEGAAVAELRAGGVQWIEGTTALLPLVKGAASPLRLSIERTITERLVVLNVRAAPFRDQPDLGRALNLATDRAALIAAVGGGWPLTGPVPDTSHPGLPHRADEARTLIERLPPSARRLTMLVQPGIESQVLAEALRAQWATVGVDVSLEPATADWLDRLVAGRYQLALAYYGPFVRSAEQYLWPYRSTARPAPNVMGYASSAVDEAFRDLTATPEETNRTTLLTKLLDLLMQAPPAVWLIESPQVVVKTIDLDVPRTGAIPVFVRARSSR